MVDAQMNLVPLKHAPTSSGWTLVGSRNGYVFWRSRNSALYAQLKLDDGSSKWFKVQR